jgi:hypothetical protein
LVRKRFRVSGTGSSGEVAEVVAVLAFVIGCDRMDGIVRVGKLGGGVDELTASEIGRVESDIEYVEQRQELLLRVIAGGLLDRRSPALHFPFISLLNRGHEQIIFAVEVVVERRLCHTGRISNPVDAHRLKAMAVEQLDRDMHEPCPASRWRIGQPEQFDNRFVLTVEDHSVSLSLSPAGRGPFWL